MEMYKALIILVILMIVFPLATSAQETKYNLETESISSRVDKILNGPITKEGLQKMPYKVWFTTNYKTYLVDTNTLKNIKRRKLKDLKILAFMGTWCHDSNREIPRLIRVCEELGIADQLELYALDVNKKSQAGREEGYNVKKTPTIIFMIDGKEVARILEEPDASFEQDLEKILK
ncbi:thioredoxin family protein [Roseivirga sp.]|uniref:thioredoxin family protein n=1 Tax=Roseivirga sp. TaxID=1964215 RepID=UPI003B8B2873